MDKSKETKRNMNIPKKNPEKKTAATSAQAPTEASAGNASAAGKGANRGEGILNAKEGKKNPKDGPSAERGENRGADVLKAVDTDAAGDIFRTGREDGAERVLTTVKEEKNSDCASETGKDEGKAVCASETGDNGNNAKCVCEAEKDGKREGDTVKTGKGGNTEENGAEESQDGSKDKNSAIAAFAAEGLKEKENAEIASCGVVEGGAENTREGVSEDEEKEKESVFKTSFPKAYAFWAKYWGLFLAPIIAFVIYFVQLAVSEVYPFGSNYVVASYDLSAQICPFIEHLFDVMDGKSSLFYSYAIAGGADVFGTFAYFFISPFSFLYLLFGDGNVYNACGVVMAFKLAAIAFAGAWFVKKLFKEIPDYLGVGIGIVYAFCGYVFVASTYVNWIDFLIYMPFCAAAFVHFVRTKKFLPFSILMACCIYTCFSIACFSMLIVFPTLIAYAFICVKREERNSFIAYLCLAFVVAVLIALPVLAAALMAYLRSGRGGGLFDDFWYGFFLQDEKYAFNVKYYFERAGEAWYRKFSYIFSDSVFVVLTIVWFIRGKLKTPLSKFMLVAGIFTMLPVFVDEAMLLMNMGSYMSYALRFGFLNALYFLGGACLAMRECSFAPEKAFDGSALRKKGREGSVLFYAIVSLVIAVILAVFVSSDLYLNIWDNFITDSGMLSDIHGFSGMFAHSLGGLQVTVVFFLFIGFVVVLGVLMLRNKEIGARVMSIMLLCVVGVQVMFYNEQLVVGNRATHYNFNHYQTMMAELNERDDSYFRIKDYEDKLTANAPFTGDSNSFSVFSSVIDRDNFEIVQLFGYSGNGRNSMKSVNGTVLGDAFLGYKYFFVSAQDPDNPKSGKWEQVNNLSYTEPVLATGEDGSSSQLQAGGFCMFENTIVFPSGYTVADGEFRFAAENTSSNRTKNQVALYEFLGGDKKAGSVTTNMVKELSTDLWARAAEIEVGQAEITAKVTAGEGECLFLNFVASKGYKVTVNGKEAQLIDNDLHFLSVKLEEGENVVVFTYSSPYVKYLAIGLAGAVAGLLVVALIVKKTKFMEKCAPVIAWAGVTLALAVVAFFMLFPTLVFLGKLLKAGWIKLVALF